MRLHQLRWRKAIVISIVCQIFFIGSVGWMAAKFFVPTDVEEYLEIQFVTEKELAEGVTPSLAQEQSTTITSVDGRTPQTTTVPRGKVAISSDSMSIAGTDVPTSVTVASVESGSSTVRASEDKGSTSNGSGVLVRKQGGLIKPSVLQRIKPIYPQVAREAGIEGTVIVKVQVLKNGRPGKVTITRTSGNEALDTAALVAAEQYQFVPAKDRDSGEAVDYNNWNIEMKFDLNS